MIPDFLIEYENSKRKEKFEPLYAEIEIPFWPNIEDEIEEEPARILIIDLF
jgi:hypothetical protein